MDKEKIKKILDEHDQRLRALEELSKQDSIALRVDLTSEEIARLPPRTQAQRITAGIDKPHYIGKMTTEVLEQLIWSIENIKLEFRTSQHKKDLIKYKKELEKRRS